VEAITDERAVSSSARRERTVVRTDIQALRAIAVTMVLLYHLWPHRLPGGFTGVDVFFVISGFLITSHLLAHAPTTGRDLATFWSRRIRRLLPASLLVLAATLLGTLAVAPDTLWSTTAAQVRAAALYVVNWRLADDSVDYLASQNAPTAVQHFWSLSLEEQFYLFWPVLILLLVLAARLLHTRPLPIVLLGLGAVVAASFVYSIRETDANPARAYFVTPTRIWELGVGGLLAGLLAGRVLGRHRDSEAIPLPAMARSILAWAGLATIGWTALAYSSATPFPGWQAAVPVLGTAAVIAACAPMTSASPGPLMAWRPVQWLGDVSYSVYLWHWPLIVLVPFAIGSPLGVVAKIVVVAASLVLAGLTKRYVEDRFRTPAWGRPLWKPFVLGAFGMAIVVIGANALAAEVDLRVTRDTAAVQRALASHNPCLGAAALAPPRRRCAPTTHAPVLPAPIRAATDISDAYGTVSGGKDCFASAPDFPITTCTRGDPSGQVRVALVGNSHAGQWLPAVEQLAAEHHWQVTTYLASQCALSDTPQLIGTGDTSHACADWVHGVTDRIIAAKYNLVIMSNRIAVRAVGHGHKGSWKTYARGYEKVLRRFHDAQVNVVGIRDTPAPGGTNLIPSCLADHPDDYTSCDGKRIDWLPREPMIRAVAAINDPRITMVNLTNFICAGRKCSAAVGGVVVYFDNSHLTATYAITLAPYLAPALLSALSR
jgi:peptidoglycan/LPS O-acetylase OafA/YrhL